MDWIQDNASAVWLTLAMLLGVAEVFSLDLVLLMLAAGCLVGAVAGAFDLPLAVQVLAAAGSSVAMLALVRPGIVHRLHPGHDLKHGFTALIGTEGFAVAEVSEQIGQVKLAGEIWTARPYDESAVIPVGARVQVFEIRGATAYVYEVPQLGS